MRIQEPPFALPFNCIIHGRYLVQEVLGHGGFGITYKGVDIPNNTTVAIKEYYPNGSAMREPGGIRVHCFSKQNAYAKGMKKFLTEARIIYHIKSNNLLKIYSLFEENGTAYYIMEFLEGKDLKQLMIDNGGKLDWDMFKPILFDVMEALAITHKKGIIHRDISPDNIYICKNGSAKLIDFGTARQVKDNVSFSVILKKGFAPPEQYSSHSKQGPWTDIYALAATSYRVLSGYMPPESLDRIRGDSLLEIYKANKSVPRHVSNAIMQAMSLDENARFQNIEDFKRSLDDGIDKKIAYFATERVRIPQGITGLIQKTNDKAMGVVSENLGNSLKNGQGENSPYIVFISGIYSNRKIRVDQNLIMGRNAEQCNLSFPTSCSDVSRVHCQLSYSPTQNKTFIEDKGSSNGTFVNGKRLEFGKKYELIHGNHVKLGNQETFIYYMCK